MDLQSGKVRDVKFLSRYQQVASLAVDGTVQFWDAHLDSIRSVRPPHISLSCGPGLKIATTELGILAQGIAVCD